jgi:hypothetical protein
LQEKDKDYIYKFRDFLKSNHPIRKVYNKKKKDGGESISYELRIYNEKIISDLKNFGIKPNKTKGMNFPIINEEFLPSYFLGLIDSDGCFTLKKHYKDPKKLFLNFSFVGPDNFVKMFQKILIKKCNISKTKIGKWLSTSFISVVAYGGFKHILSIVKYVYQSSPVFFHRKRDLALNYLLNKYPKDNWIIETLKIKSI